MKKTVKKAVELDPVCPVCKGTGRIDDKTSCESCKGTGKSETATAQA